MTLRVEPCITQLSSLVILLSHSIEFNSHHLWLVKQFPDNSKQTAWGIDFKFGMPAHFQFSLVIFCQTQTHTLWNLVGLASIDALLIEHLTSYLMSLTCVVDQHNFFRALVKLGRDVPCSKVLILFIHGRSSSFNGCVKRWLTIYGCFAQ